MQLENDKASIAFLAVQGVIEELTYKRVIVANEALQSKVYFSCLTVLLCIWVSHCMEGLN